LCQSEPAWSSTCAGAVPFPLFFVGAMRRFFVPGLLAGQVPACYAGRTALVGSDDRNSVRGFSEFC
jgi:hypothetical protein